MNEADDEIGPWSEDKLKLLGKYLNAYVTIMNKQKWCDGYHYVDAFAGTGRPRARDEARYIDGSPRVALKVRYPFDSYTFIEMDPNRVQRLSKLEQEFPSRHIDIRQGDCNDVLVNHVIPRICRNRRHRGLIFLDPFGMEVEWKTVKRIAQTKMLEIFINFPVMAINRTALLNDPTKITDAQIERTNRFWGTPDWYGDIYKAKQYMLFGGSIERKPHSTTAKRLGNLYKSRLLEEFSYVTDPLVMTNSRNNPLYCLILAGPNAKGAEIVQDIFKRYERLGE